MNLELFEAMKRDYTVKGVLTPELAEYRVDNAVILAAGITKYTIYSPPSNLSAERSRNQ